MMRKEIDLQSIIFFNMVDEYKKRKCSTPNDNSYNVKKGFFSMN